MTFVTVVAGAALLSACAGAPSAGDVPAGSAAAVSVGPPPATEPNLGAERTPIPATTPDAASIAQAEAWLDAIALPEGAVRTDDNTRLYTTFIGWICAPIAGRHAEWLVPNAGVDDTIAWIRDNPPAGLQSTTGDGSFGDRPPPTSATLGFTPDDRSQQGVLFTVDRRGSGVAVRADVVALGATSVCPTPDPGTSFGLPGQG